jgi:hypothetical protein
MPIGAIIIMGEMVRVPVKIIMPKKLIMMTPMKTGIRRMYQGPGACSSRISGSGTTTGWLSIGGITRGGETKASVAM